ncbi:MAG: hypothetical protein OHK0048_24800 [Rhodoferax sp.]
MTQRLWVDVTRTCRNALHTGIQRVVRQLLAALQQRGTAMGVAVLPVVFEAERWYALDFLPPHVKQWGAPTTTAAAMPRSVPLQPGAGDVIVLADAAWYLDPWPAVDSALARGATLVGVVHDVLAVMQPQWFRPGLGERFARYVHALAERAERVVVPTSVVAHNLEAVLGQGRVTISVLAWAGDFWAPARTPPRQAWPLDTQAPFVLTVGTVEPRKGHALVLEAMEALWAQGSHLRWVVAGAPGWCTEALAQRLRAHPQAPSRLMWLDSVSDAALLGLYDHAQALVFASADEGFGLPLAEAAARGCPVLAADVPVAREVGGNWAAFLPRNDVTALIDALAGLAPRAQPAMRPRGTATRRWLDVADDVLSLTDRIDKRVDPSNRADVDNPCTV